MVYSDTFLVNILVEVQTLQGLETRHIITRLVKVVFLTATDLDGNPANRATGHPSPVPW